MIDFIKKHYLFSLIVVAFSVITIFFSWVLFKGYFFSDDFTWLWHGQKIGSISDVLQFKMASFYSPVMNFLFALWWRLFGYVAWPYFVINLILHVGVSVVVGFLTSKIVKNKKVGLIATGLFAMAGGAYEPVIWIGANLHLVVVLFLLLGLYFCWQYFESKKVINLLLSLVFIVLSLLTKEIAVVGIGLLFLLFVYNWEIKSFLKDKKLWLYSSFVILIYGFYGWQQYLWQKQSYWLSSGTWDFNLKYLAKIPLVLFDVVVPSQWFVGFLSHKSAILIAVVILIVIVGGLVKFFRNKVLWFTVCWMIFSVMPTIFFKSALWWEPIASRYTYLPRVGLVIGLSSFLYFLWEKKNGVVKYGCLFVLISIIVYGQVVAVFNMGDKYPFVYQTGESLVEVIEDARVSEFDKICVLPGRPFENNVSYIVGAGKVVANYAENDILFVEDVNNCPISYIIEWDKANEKFIKYE